MSNLFIWFNTVEERRAFVLELLEIPELVQRNGTKKAQREQEALVEDLSEHMAHLEKGKTSSPYYNLYKYYYFGIIPEWEKRPVHPWEPLAVFEKGFRQLYTQESYYHRPGKWLVIQFRNTKKADERYNWIMERIPETRLGTNIPLPTSRKAELKVEWVEQVFNQKDFVEMKLLLKMHEELKYTEKNHPTVFKGERVYLWERMAWAFHGHNHLKKAEECLRTQASLQPGKSDAYLNLGVFLTDAGLYNAAIKVYKEGLAITPGCEFLNYNLAMLCGSMGKTTQAQLACNNAMLANPTRPINYFSKGELCLEKNQYQAAIQYFEQAVELCTDDEWKGTKIASMRYMGEAYMQLDDYKKAAYVLKRVLSLDPSCELTHMHLATCYKKLQNPELALWHSRKALQLSKGSL